MIEIIFNQQSITFAANCTLRDFLQQQASVSGNFSVAINQQFILRAHYATTMLQHQDQIDIIKPMQGG